MANTNHKILIIEDDKEIAALEKDFLEISGFTVVTEGDGLKGAERALSENFALIMLDLMLPGKDGISLCREIREKIDIPILRPLCPGKKLLPRTFTDDERTND